MSTIDFNDVAVFKFIDAVSKETGEVEQIKVLDREATLGVVKALLEVFEDERVNGSLSIRQAIDKILATTKNAIPMPILAMMASRVLNSGMPDNQHTLLEWNRKVVSFIASKSVNGKEPLKAHHLYWEKAGKGGGVKLLDPKAIEERNRSVWLFESKL
jgi:hypothetical protein